VAPHKLAVSDQVPTKDQQDLELPHPRAAIAGDIEGVRPLFSLVVATYGVEEWIAEFLEGLRRQEGGLDDTEVIFVIDGSPDRSEEIVRAWAAADEQVAVQVVVQENAGVSAARNAGLDLARGEWVTFPDPDDILDDRYLAGVRDYLARGDEPDSIVARSMPFHGDTAEADDDHPLSFRFMPGTRTVDLDLEPRYFPFATNHSFSRLDRVRASGVRFDTRVRPVLEDAVYTANYLASSTSHRVGIVAESIYLYRRRGDGSSLLDSVWNHDHRYTDVLRYGFRTVMDRYASGQVPKWLEYMALYDLQWYFKTDGKPGAPTAAVSGDVLAEFHDLLDDLLAQINPESFIDYNATHIPSEIRMAWYAAGTGRVPDDQVVRVDVIDRRQQAIRFVYYQADPSQVETIRQRGVIVAPMGAKFRALKYFGRTFVYQRIGWVDSLSDWTITLAGESRTARILHSNEVVPLMSVTPELAWRRLQNHPVPHRKLPAPVAGEPAPQAGRVRRLVGRVQRRLAREVAEHKASLEAARLGRDRRRMSKRAESKLARERYRHAWVLVDRDTMARDNAETLYRYLRAEHPEINAWFVINRTSPDYARLVREGFRVVAHGSREHVVLMKNASHLISSNVDRYIVEPYDFGRFGRSRWRFTFLQHGVTKDDLSHWLNGKLIHRVLATGQAEFDAFVGDGTPYWMTEREVALTGFPRHDDLQRRLEETPAERRNVLLITPTWRQYLVDNTTTMNGNQRAVLDGFKESDYYRSWIGLLNHPELREAAVRAGVEIAFAPHPNLQGHLSTGDVPDWVQMVSYADSDIKEWLARSVLTVSDYSSLAFDAAYVRTPSVYFQFDREQFFSGAHAYRKGYFSYEEDGFGPVVDNIQDAVAAIKRRLETPREFIEPYAERIERVFTYRDTRNCERVVDSIKQLNRPMRKWDREVPGGILETGSSADAMVG
jgi:glycosyltransferase involved in cell wall biosynthesis